jgi:lactoylglutathione lyase
MEINMKLGYTIIYVKNVKETVGFYQKAFGIKLKYMSESSLFAAMDTGTTMLSFVSEEFVQNSGIKFRQNKLNEVQAGFQISFFSDDVDKAFEKSVKEGATAISLPSQTPWGQRVAIVLDNNGVFVEICSPFDFD